MPFSKLTEGLVQIAHDVNIVSEYAAINGLSLNIGISEILILESNAYVSQIELSDLPVSVGGINLPDITD